MTTNLIPPAFILVIGALFIPFLRGNFKRAYMLLLPIAVLITLLNLDLGNYWAFKFSGFDLILGRMDKLARIFALIFTIMAFIGVLFALKVEDDLQHVSGLVYAGSTLGVVMAGDLLSLYVFWEIMAVASTFLVIAPRTRASRDAGFRYLLVHLAGGLFLLAGIIFYIHHNGTTTFDYIGLRDPYSWFIFIGIALNAAAIPLHAWLPDAYPMGTPTSTVFLSAFTTKSAVYLLVRTFPGTDLLIVIGALMVSVPIFYAVLENDIRRVLSYSLMNQVGFMLVGIGIGTELALNGTVAHAFCHILYKALLFMAAGSVLQMTGKIKCTEIGGLYKTMPLTCLFCMVGAASISAFPLFSGFVSKSMIVSASAHEKFFLIWLVLQFASTGVVDHAGIKVPFFTFFGHDSGIRAKEPPLNMLLAMGFAAFLCVGLGVYYQPLYNLLPFAVDYQPYTGSHVVGQLQLLLFGAFAFTLLILSGYYVPEVRSRNLDADWFYRKFGKLSYRAMDKGFNALNRVSEQGILAFVKEGAAFFRQMATHVCLFFAVNFWLLLGYRDKRLAHKKLRLYNDISHGTLPIGIGAAVAISFVFLIFALT
ncbi:Na(+)/H(+) antiporter subunit D [Desulfospira joergensenii]|uniref:Na(+)/H(+) antiporter subunit D n=1 Tax=Desulfospira joergensenii TaxID=53329 RepID=UPI0003B722BB|nr:Na(+)/H(+) antiporter subunit D [Desulfospira joergensenii]